MSTPRPDVTVVMPTRDRPDLLACALSALAAQRTARTWELVLVDDASSPPVDASLLARFPDAQLIRGPGLGPARARNLGVAAARGDIVLFTDDDTEPDPGWLEAAASHLDAHPRDLAVEGTVRSLPFDPLYAHSVERSVPGGYMTCNLGVRRDVLATLGDFSEDYPYPHCEDLDLAYRILEAGPIGFAAAMVIVHHPRPLTMRQWMRRGRMTESEIVLFARFPERFGRAGRLPPRLFPLASAVGFWREMLRAGRQGPARRLARAIVICIGYTAWVIRVSLLRGRGRTPTRLPQPQRPS